MKKSCNQLCEFYLVFFSFSLCEPHEVKSEWDWEKTGPRHRMWPPLLPWKHFPLIKDRVVSLILCVCVLWGGDIFGREKGEGSSIFFPLQQYIKLHTIEETLHLIVHWSTDIINNWKNGEKGGEAKCWPYMIKRSTDLGWYATQSHTLKTSGEKRRAGLISMTLIVDHFKFQVTMSASMKLNVAMNWVIAASVLIIVTWDLNTAHRQQTHHRLCHHSDPVLTLRLYNIQSQ